MTKQLMRVTTHDQLPSSTEVVIIGGGIIGVTAALTLAERNIPVVLIEKGSIGAEQSSRNLGWIRKTSRHAQDLPLAQAADELWQNMAKRVGLDVGYRQQGIMFLANTESLLAWHESWLNATATLAPGSRLLSNREIEERIPGGREKWAGALYTPSDGRAEPDIACSAISIAAMNKGATIIQQCAARTLSFSAGKISGVVTERGEIHCRQVLLAGGAWSRRFLGNTGVSLPTLPVICSVLRTTPMDGPTEIAVGAPDFSFRRHRDGGFIITQRGKVDAPITLDHLKIGWQHRQQFRTGRQYLNVRFGSHFFNDLRLARRWNSQQQTPFESVRTLSPEPNRQLNQDALNNLGRAWPIFSGACIAEDWAGVIDVTPDSLPVIDYVDSLPGLTIACGFSGHGFGTGPAAGQLAADLICQDTPIVDPAPYRFTRFH